VTNNEIIELANEANRIVRALDALTGRGDDDPEVRELGDRLDQVMGRTATYPDNLLLMFAMKMLEGKPYGAHSDNPETVRRLDSLAADIGARNKRAWTFPGVPGTGTVYEPPDQH
jgi:hypothetical protein